MMYFVVIALLPAVAASIYFFKMGAIVVIVPAIAACYATEVFASWLRGRRLPVADGSVLITALLLAMTLPPFTPWYVTVVGSVFAVGVAKHVFGGLGNNIFNPALAGRAFLMACYADKMTSWTSPEAIKTWALTKGGAVGIDAVTQSTPLALAKFDHDFGADLWRMFWGQTGGSLGETAAICLIAGGIFLLVMKVIDWRVPAAFIGSVFLFSGALWLYDLELLTKTERFANPLYHLLAGGLMLGAFFMATDLVTSPVTRAGRLAFGAGCGILTVLIRVWGGFPEGVMFAILVMNSLTPLINRLTAPIPFGGRPKNV